MNAGIGICAIGAAARAGLRTGGLRARFARTKALPARRAGTETLPARFAPEIPCAARLDGGRDAAAAFRREAVLNIRLVFCKKGTEPMHTEIHPLLDMRSGERAVLVFNVRDGAGMPVDLSEAEAEYRIARRAGERALLTLHSGDDGGIALDGSAARVSIDTALLAQNGRALLGDFFAQLRLTVDEVTLIAAEGPLCIHPVILPAGEDA